MQKVKPKHIRSIPDGNRRWAVENGMEKKEGYEHGLMPGLRRLSGFLPIQSVYSDFYVVDHYWPDYEDEDFTKALLWYSRQDVTLGG